MTSHGQRRLMSKVLQSKPSPISVSNVSKTDTQKVPNNDNNVEVKVDQQVLKPNNVGDMINQIIEKKKGKGVTKIKIEIEICSE